MPQNDVQVSYFDVAPDEQGQRLDNWLLARLKGVPRSHVYRIIRSGEVRVNKGRAKPPQRLNTGDVIRVPPIRRDEDQGPPRVPDALKAQLAGAVLYRDDDILVLNKPAGLAVHGGSGLGFGLIDVVRALWGLDWLLVHRLDRETTGCLLLVRRRELQREFQEQLQADAVVKEYLALVHGRWDPDRGRIESHLDKAQDASGERRVRARAEAAGKQAVSHFRIERQLSQASLLAVRIETGRTHQIRVQVSEAGHPILGDGKYGRRQLDQALGLTLKLPLCLHARALSLKLGGSDLAVNAPLPDAFSAVLKSLEPQ